MTDANVHAAQLILLLLLLFVTVFAALARRLRTPYPIILVLAGLLLGFVPKIPTINLDPDIIFLVVLPPLLYSAAVVTSWREMSYNMVSIAMMAIGLVGFTVGSVATAGPWLFPGFDWRTGFLLGAVVATTDAIAATSIANRVGLPKRIVDLLEGESLLNDATGLLALEFGIGIVVYGQSPTIAASVWRLVYLTLVAIGTGLLIGRIVEWIEHQIDDAPIEIAFSILVPYATYLAAESLHASGVLAVVSTGLYLGRKSSEFLSPAVRLQIRAVWNSIEFILNGFVFVLIGLQLPSVLAAVRDINTMKLLMYGGIFSIFLILARLACAFPGAYVAHFIRTNVLHQDEPQPSTRQIFVIGWTGMRGVIALAAAMSLPRTLADGRPFPDRDFIVFLTFAVILVTLVLQGLTLPSIIRLLGFERRSHANSEPQEARRIVLEAAISRLEAIRRENHGVDDPLYDDLAKHYAHRLAGVAAPQSKDSDSAAEPYVRYLELSLDLLKVERQTALGLRNEGRIPDEVSREMEHEFDLNEIRLRVAVQRAHEGDEELPHPQPE